MGPPFCTRIRTCPDARSGGPGRASRGDRGRGAQADRVGRRAQARRRLGRAQDGVRDRAAKRGRLSLLPLRRRKPLLDDLDHTLKITDGVLRFRVFKVDPTAPTAAPPATGQPVAAAPGRRSSRRNRRAPGSPAPGLFFLAGGEKPPRGDLELDLNMKGASQVAATNINRVVLTGNLTARPRAALAPERHLGLQAARRVQHAAARTAPAASGSTSPTTSTSPSGARRARTAPRYLSKGRPVAIDGRLEWREWETQDGHKRQAVEIIADTVQFLGSRERQPGRRRRQRLQAELRRAGRHLRLRAGGGRAAVRGGRRHPLLASLRRSLAHPGLLGAGTAWRRAGDFG